MKMEYRAYVLVEILVVVVVVGILTIAGIASYTRFRAKQELMHAGESLVSELRLIQKEATGATVGATCGGGLQKTTFTGAAGSNTVVFGYACTPPITKNISLKNKVAIKTNVSVEFTASTGFSPVDKTIELKNATGTCTIPITISGGSISLGDISGC
jgi:type II secretory pathway pseudopilin PulG